MSSRFCAIHLQGSCGRSRHAYRASARRCYSRHRANEAADCGQFVEAVYSSIVRILSVRVQNIGGLQDGIVPLPQAPVVALAGANGSGKSRFLRCISAPWNYEIPEPSDALRESYVEVELGFSDIEMRAQVEFANQQGIHGAAPRQTALVRKTRTPLGGNAITTTPSESHWIAQMLQSQDVMKFYPSFDLVFVPAERRLSSQGGPFTLVSIDPESNARSAAALRQGYGPSGILDDYEFEDYAKTLCIAAYLPRADGRLDSDAGTAWDQFLEGVNGVLDPKRLLPLSQDDPSNLRIALPDGTTHGIEGLSSGERQALIVISRVFRAGEGHTTVIIDEPDAYLHPSLSSRLMHALRLGLPGKSALVVATHSPSILDSLDPSEIVRFQHGAQPALVLDEANRIDLYRSAGFRASAITQSDLLMVTEGTFDAQVLLGLIPELRNASIHSPGGKDLVFRDVKALHGFDLPILGVVDADILADEIPEDIREICHVWNSADIEGVLLSSPEFLQHCLEAGLFRAEFEEIVGVEDMLRDIVAEFRQTAITEYAIRSMRSATSPEWPSPRDPEARVRLEALGAEISARIDGSVGSSFDQAGEVWESGEVSKWALVRGKYVMKKVVSTMTGFRSTDAFVRAALAGRPSIPEIETLRQKVTAALP